MKLIIAVVQNDDANDVVDALLEADRREAFTVQESMQPVPGTGLESRAT